MRSHVCALTSKVTGDRGAGEGPPAGVRVDREVRRLALEAWTNVLWGEIRMLDADRVDNVRE